MGGDQGGTTADPTVQRHRLLGDQALLQQPQQSRPRPRPAMQQPPQGLLVAAGMPPSQGSGRLVSAEKAAQAEAARTRAAEQMAFEDAWKALNPDFRTPFASVEDAVSRLLPYHVFADYEEDDDVVEPINGGNSSISTTTDKSSAQNWDDGMAAQVEGFLEHFEKQVLTFNVMTQQHAAGFNRTEEQLSLERFVVEDERRQLELLRAAVAQRQQQEQQEATRARLALAQAQAQAQAVGGWQAAQPAASWQAFVAAGRGEGASRGQALPPAVVMQQQQQQQEETMMTAGAWQALAAAVSRGEGGSNEQALIQAVMVQHMQRQRQQEEMMAAASRGEGASFGQALPPAMVAQLMQQQNQQRQQEEMMTAAFRGEVASGEQARASAMMMRQMHLLQQQPHQQEVMAAGGWQLGLGGRQTYAIAPRGDGSSSSQAAAASSLPPAMLQLQQPGPGQGQASIAGSGMALPWHGMDEGREQ